jgi:hypothetical protein
MENYLLLYNSRKYMNVEYVLIYSQIRVRAEIHFLSLSVFNLVETDCTEYSSCNNCRKLVDKL